MALSGTSLPGNSPTHFVVVEFYTDQTQEKGTDLKGNDHMDLRIALRDDYLLQIKGRKAQKASE